MKKRKHPPQLTAGRLTVLTLAMMGALGALAAMAPTVAKAQSHTISGTMTSQVNWTSGDLTAGASDSLIVGDTAVLATGTSLGALSNSGTISGGYSGIYRSYGGTIGMLSNSGTINGSRYSGIYNDGTITGLTNSSSGTIKSSSTNGGTGINNYSNIGTLTNNGAIDANNGTGNGIAIYNRSIGTIGASGVDSSGLYNTGAIDGGNVGIYNDGSITTLTNSSDGTIKSSSTNSGNGIYNTGNIGMLTNNGAISDNGGSGNGIYNSGAIGVTGVNSSGIYNTGIIHGGNAGIFNDSGSITTLTNSSTGVISGAAGYGISNSSGSSIDALTNSGSISGNNNGIDNSGAITALTNNNGGTINSSSTASGNGISSSGSIGTLTNNGAISANGSNGNGIYNIGNIGTSGVDSSGIYNTAIIHGGNVGIFNDMSGTITALTNSGGIISGGNTGIYNNGFISTLNNSNGGTISGVVYAISNDGTLGPITNAGVIAGNIANTSSNDLIINGGTGSTFGTLTGSGAGIGANNIGTITNTSSNVVFGSGKQLLNDNIDTAGSPSVVAFRVLGLLSSSNTVTNTSTGTLQVNNQISITGDYSQGSSATLNIGVADGAMTTGVIGTDSGYGRLVVSGIANIAAGSTVALTQLNSYAFAQGQRYVVVVANNTSGTNYNVGNLTYTATGFNGTITGTSVVDGSNLDLLLSLSGAGSPSSPISPASSTPINSATTPNAVSSLSGMFNYTGTNAALMNLSNAAAALGGSPAAANRAGAQLSPTATVAATSQAAAAPTDAVLGVVGAHVDGLRVAQADGQSGVAAGESPTGVALWGQAFGGNATQDQRDGISGYHAGYNGLLIGADTMLNDNWRVGGLGSYANTSVANDGDNSGSSTHVTSYGLIGYAAYTTDKWYLDMSAGAVQQQYNSVRAIGFNGFSGTANGQFNGMQYVASVQGGYPIKLASDTTLTPLAGLSYSRQHQDAYTETGGNGAALSVGATNSNSVKSDIGAKLERSFATAYGALAPSAQLTWRHEYNKNGVQSVASYAADTTGTTSFTTLGPTPVADTGVLALAVTLTRSENVRLTARYTVEAASGYTSQTADVRLRYQF